MIIRLYRIIWGFLEVRFYGEQREKILAICAQNGITLWNLRLTAFGIESKILIKDFKLLRHICPKGVRVHILKKFGLPFLTNRYRKRWGLLVGAVLFFAIIQTLSSFVWVISVNGNHKVSEKEILNACKNIGITEGVKKSHISPKLQRERLLLQLDKIAWAAINIDGSHLTVTVTEAKEKPKVEGNYSNLKADFDGIILKMDIVSGTSVAKVGQAVKKGDLLVSGIIETTDGNRFVKSKGNVTARITKEYEFKESFTQKAKIPTGKTKLKYAVQLFTLKVPLYLNTENGEYTESKSFTRVKLFGNELPVKIYKKRFEFYRVKNVKLSYESLCKRLEKRFKEATSESIDLKIESKEFIKTKDGVTLNVTVKETKNIQYEDILLINAGN